MAQKSLLGRQQLVAALFLTVLSSGCGLWVTPDKNQIEPAQRSARLDEVHRTQALQTVDMETRAILRQLPRYVYGASERDLETIVRQVVHTARQHGIDPFLVAAVITVESYYHPEVISYAGAVGLMQVLPYVGEDVAKRHGIEWRGWQTLTEPHANITIGTAYLRELIDMFAGDTSLALAAYNIGPSLLKQRLRQGWRPNGPYVPKVMGIYRELHGTTVADERIRQLMDRG